MRLLLIAAVLAACVDEDPARGLREVEPCSNRGTFEGDPIEQCARACVAAPFPSGPMDCMVTPTDSLPADKCPTPLAFEIDGVRGCCNDTVRVDGKPTAIWNACLD